MDKFWQKPIRIIQNNLRAVDAKDMDVEKLIATQAEYGTNVIVCNAGGLLCWYDSEISRQPKNPYLSFDYVEEVIRHAHARGMKVLLRLDVSNLSEKDFKEHPEWARRDTEGNFSYDLGMIQSCFNSPYWQKFNFDLLDELLGKYDCDGIFYNAIHYGFCHCDKCKAVYREKTGRPLPGVLDTAAEEGKLFIRFRYNEVTEYFEKVRNFIRERKPNAVLAPVGSVSSDAPEFNCFSGWDTLRQMTRAQDIQVSETVDSTRRAHPKYIYLTGDSARVANHMGQQTVMCLHYANMGRRVAQPPLQHAFNIMEGAAYGGSLCMNISGTFDIDDRKSLPAIKSLYNYLAKNEKYYTGLKNLGGVGLVMSRKTLDFGVDRDATAFSPQGIMSKPYPKRHLEEYRGIYETLVRQHVLFNVIYDDCIESADLSQYGAIILPGVSCMSDRQIEMLDKYVAEGGRLIATGDLPATRDAEGRARGGIAMASLPYGLNGNADSFNGYFGTHDKALWKSLAETDLAGVSGRVTFIKPKTECDVKLKGLNLIPGPKNNKPEFAFITEDEKTDEYGLYVNGYKKGTAAVFPWDLGGGFRQARAQEYERFLMDTLDCLGWSREIETDAPYTCEVALADTGEGQLLHLINATGMQASPLTEIIPLRDISVRLKTTAASAVSLTSGLPLTTEYKDGTLTIHIDRLELFEAAALKG